MDCMQVVNYCAAECERQHTSPVSVGHMFFAWYLADGFTGPVRESGIFLIENAVNDRALSFGYRRTAVSFASGGRAADWQEVPRLMGNLLAAQDTLTPDEFAKEFLDIHPFEDGNGRTASLLWNYLRGTIQSPDMLPEFDFV